MKTVLRLDITYEAAEYMRKNSCFPTTTISGSVALALSDNYFHNTSLLKNWYNKSGRIHKRFTVLKTVDIEDSDINNLTAQFQIADQTTKFPIKSEFFFEDDEMDLNSIDINIDYIVKNWQLELNICKYRTETEANYLFESIKNAAKTH